VEAVVEIHEGVGRPELRPKFFAGHDIAGTLEQYRQHLQRLPSQPQLYTVLAQLARAVIEFKNVEPKDWGGCGRRRHLDFQKRQQDYHSSRPLEPRLHKFNAFIFNTLTMEETLRINRGRPD
jgi:hypothetical protein